MGLAGSIFQGIGNAANVLGGISGMMGKGGSPSGAGNPGGSRGGAPSLGNFASKLQTPQAQNLAPDSFMSSSPTSQGGGPTIGLGGGPSLDGPQMRKPYGMLSKF